jgi:hypothetical protein
MPSEHWWDSLEQLDKRFRLARNTAVVAGGLSIAAWGMWLVLIAVPATVVTMTAILFTLFLWFRRDDLSRTTGRRP